MMVNANLTRGLLLGAAALGALAGSAFSASAQGVVNVYTNREPGLYSSTLDEFTKATGIKVNAIFSEQGLAERIKAEGENSPADVLITVDVGRLQEALDLGITQPLKSQAIESAVPAQLRDPEGRWFALSMRARAVYASKDRVKDTAITYEDLADPKWKGKICTRSFQHQYNLALTAAMIVKHGEAKTEEWLKGVKANLAKKPSGGDRDVAKDIMAGVCDIGLGNTYYVGLMTNGTNAEQKKWAEAIHVILPTFQGGGSHVNVSGAALMKHAPNKDNAIKLIEFMTTPEAQHVFADVNYEYPIRPGVAVNPLIQSFGALKPDAMAISAVGKARAKASELVDKVGFDR
ncbi:Fe(3+) ABC transporter substrate-binding protein [Microvirga terricola]|uniref:Fe(3+) ABC transporter substrate-binding protein n=1 Tax=Microvirga terricola TaxID=2719797 RepID=A0ABX0VBN8_9HYPH|nr:Fe(3+) ABC transporter substrate-binding protein [Microvirga terricola]NIX77113.1 Fe(3+) ABC transporter substrate-binding protein [Microvirga terricola]